MPQQRSIPPSLLQAFTSGWTPRVPEEVGAALDLRMRETDPQTLWGHLPRPCLHSFHSRKFQLHLRLCRLCVWNLLRGP